MTIQETDDREKVLQMLDGYMISQPLYVVVKLGIPSPEHRTHQKN